MTVSDQFGTGFLVKHYVAPRAREHTPTPLWKQDAPSIIECRLWNSPLACRITASCLSHEKNTINLTTDLLQTSSSCPFGGFTIRILSSSQVLQEHQLCQPRYQSGHTNMTRISEAEGMLPEQEPCFNLLEGFIRISQATIKWAKLGRAEGKKHEPYLTICSAKKGRPSRCWTSFSHFHLAELLPGKQKSGPVNRRACLHELEQLGTASNTISRHRK